MSGKSQDGCVGRGTEPIMGARKQTPAIHASLHVETMQDISEGISPEGGGLQFQMSRR